MVGFFEKLVVSKFGGTSMGDASCMKRSAEVAIHQNSKIIVVSATAGTTNELIALAHHAQQKNWNELEEKIERIKMRHQLISNQLGCQPEDMVLLEGLFEEMTSLSRGIYLLKDISVKALDALLSLGERMSSVLFARCLQNEFSSANLNLKAQLLDVRKILLTDDSYGKARPKLDEIRRRCGLEFENLKHNSVVFVTQGFIGSTEEGTTTTLGRGGSDYSAALLSEGVRADILEIWTDVAGISTTDPRICKDAKVIPEMTFREASEMAVFGAKVLHPATLVPAIRQNIPVFVGSSFDRQFGGTWIKKNIPHLPNFRGLALKPKQVLVTLSTPEMLNAHGFLFQIFKLFNDHEVSVDSITTSEISVALTVDEGTLENKKLFFDLEQIAEVQIEKGLTLISLIGNNINYTPGISRKIFESISEINVRMICQGASRHNYCFLVDEKMGPECVNRLHRIFID